MKILPITCNKTLVENLLSVKSLSCNSQSTISEQMYEKQT